MLTMSMVNAVRASLTEQPHGKQVKTNALEFFIITGILILTFLKNSNPSRPSTRTFIY